MGRVFVGKSIEACGLILVGMALLIGLGDNAMGRELRTLAFGAAVFLVGYWVETRAR